LVVQRRTINRVVLQNEAKPVDQRLVESGFVAISGEVDTCSISTGDSWTEGTRGILRFQRKNVAFLKEPGGISRIPRNGIIKTPSSMQFPGISETVSTGLNSGYKKTTNPLCLQFIGIVPFEITGYKII
jgi:hypothetical protein